ncbi:uncharacterized protein LOC110100685 [Dendrobium catenatum]|uniref:uncharacterized protein LOC110100685 n=1 Tax=Dendrobium catenatum TaxID=906689 RepID=UPI0009F544F4|nr:uncharacterized protein LOC110100685 [Dendrobium catenatum]
MQKSGILFGLAVKKGRRKICKIMNFKEVQEFTYLGTKVALRRLKISYFQLIVEKALNMLNVWGGKLISLAGKITLVKSVLLSYPIFHTALSLVPKKILYEVEKACRDFIWSKSECKKGMHYVSWEMMCKPKKLGGLGISSCSAKAGPLRVKLSLRYCQEKNSLMHKVLFPKYGPIMVDDYNRRGGSSSWKLIQNGGEFLKPLVRWSVAVEALETGEADCIEWSWFKKSKLNPRVDLWWRLFKKAVQTSHFLCYRRLQGNEVAYQPSRLLKPWHPPPSDWIKVNIDAALFKSYKAGIGGAFRAHQGRLLLAFGRKLIYRDPGALELQAIISLKLVFKEWMSQQRNHN